MDKDRQEKKKLPGALEPLTLTLIVITSILGAIIGMQLIVSLGIAANTSIIGALIAMLIARIPVTIFQRLRSVHRQNLVQSAISSATFGAANSLFIPIGVPFVLGRPDLIIPMLIGAVLAMFADALILYRLFDSKVFPGQGTWPAGVATAEAILAGDQGGRRAGLLGIGTAGGILGAYLGIPMSAFGVAFIGNIWALTMFGLGLLVSGYSTNIFGLDLNELYIPHGIMIGAGLVALVQVSLLIFSKRKEQDQEKTTEDEVGFTRSERESKRTLLFGFLGYLLISLIIALIGGIMTDMSLGMLLLYLVFAAFAAYVHELIVGIAAMYSGWFPAFAVALITLVIGILFGFPPVALALLVGFSAATGPAFADMGYDMKTGYILRGNGEDKELELAGRKQQMIAGMIAFGVAAIAVFVSYETYFAQNLVPPVDKVYVATIQSGVSTDIAIQLFLWAIPGALLQWFGGAGRQLGVLFATGLLIATPAAGWAVLVGILIRAFFLNWKGKKAEGPMTILAAGFIAGDSLYSFFNSLFKVNTK